MSDICQADSNSHVTSTSLRIYQMSHFLRATVAFSTAEYVQVLHTAATTPESHV